MSENEEALELQSEELEVLESIYEGDSSFVALSKTKYQYKFGEDASSKSFILDIEWTPLYPNELPSFSMDCFYNRNVIDSVKTQVIESVTREAEQYLGMSMTYTIYEYVRENLEELLKDQPETIEINEMVDKLQIQETSNEESTISNKPKKEQLTKAQKRRMWDKGGLETDERPRGWNWMNLITHLSQTGSK